MWPDYTLCNLMLGKAPWCQLGCIGPCRTHKANTSAKSAIMSRNHSSLFTLTLRRIFSWYPK